MPPSEIVIFGTGAIAEVAHFYFEHDSDKKVVAFTADRDFVSGDAFLGLPLVPFDEIEQRYPPAAFGLFVAVSYSGLNKLRAQKCAEAMAKGYELPSYVSSRATTLPGFTSGYNCFILEDNTIQPFVSIGDDVTLWSGNHIGHHSRIGNHCFVSSHVVISGGVEVGDYTFIGVNSTLRDHIKVGESCVIGAGSLLAADAEAGGVYAPTPTERSRVPSSRLRQI
jgi:sugar O-acyltransferase (sialic acid O-acetyltransferase NeuD family)